MTPRVRSPCFFCVFLVCSLVSAFVTSLVTSLVASMGAFYPFYFQELSIPVFHFFPFF